MFFGEVMMTFGCRSSAGIFDDGAKLVKKIAVLRSHMNKEMVNQVLDDVVACGAQGDGTVTNFYKCYRDVCNFIGVSLADEEDKDKAFSSSTSGKVLGISYDLERWTWWLSEDKLTPLVLMLAEVRDKEEVENGHMMSLNGRLNHYMYLIPGGTWQRGFLLKLQDSKEPHSKRFVVDAPARKQAAWWITHARAACVESKIVDPMPHHRMDPVAIYTDAAGGNRSEIKNGVGSFAPPSNWAYIPWSPLIREDRPNSEGVRFAHKLCCLEGFAALVGLVTVPDRVRNNEANIYCDNAGFVAVFKKRHSKCPYAYTVAKAIFDVGLGLSCKVNVIKTRRCSGIAEEAADALSKGDWERAWSHMPMKNVDPERIPVSLLLWMSNPSPDLLLGSRILSDMSKYTNVLHLT